MNLVLQKTKNTLLAALVLVLLASVFAALVPASAGAQRCYADYGNFNVDPETHPCPEPGSNVVYRDFTSGNNLPNAPTAGECYSGVGLTGGGAASISYRRQNCTDLESLRITALTNECTAAGGQVVWQSSTNAAPVQVCSCPNNRIFQNGQCIHPSSGANTSTPTYVKNDCDGDNIQAGLPEDNVNHCGILDYLVLAINLLSALVGVVVVASIVYGAIQYSSAGGDPQKVSAAKTRIRNALVAFLFFIFAYSFLNYLVPGGVL